MAINAKDRWGQTAMSEAIYFKHHDIVKLLQKYDRRGLGKQAYGKLHWKQIVEKKVMVQEHLIKFDKHLVKKKSSFGFSSYMEGLASPSKMQSLREADEAENESQAASMIQRKYRDYLKRKTSAEVKASFHKLTILK